MYDFLNPNKFNDFIDFYDKKKLRATFWIQTIIKFSLPVSQNLLKNKLSNPSWILYGFSFVYAKNNWSRAFGIETFFFFSTFMTKAFEKRTTFWTETISLGLRFIPSVLKHYRPTKKDRFTVTNKNTSRHSSGHAFIHNPFFNLGFLSRIFTI